MIETFSDLAKLLDDGWRITGIRADSDGERQTFRFEVEARKQPARQPAITPEGWEIGSGFAEFLHSVGHGNLDTELRDLGDAR